MSKFYTEVFQRGQNIFVRGYNNGKRVQKKVAYKPYLFIGSQSQDTKYRTLDGNPVEKFSFDSIREARDFVEKYKDVDNFSIYGLTNYLYAYLNDEYSGDMDYDYSLIRRIGLDIECAPMRGESGFPNIETANQMITAITCKYDGQFVSFGCGEYENHLPNVRYVKCVDEKELLRQFVLYWVDIDPDIITGWNIEFFDIPYLVNRIRRVLGDTWVNKLSPWEIVKEGFTEINERRQQTYEIMGVCCLDYLQLYKKFTYTNQESYKLDHIAFVELGERKLDYSEYSTLTEFYYNDFQKYMEYNIHDTELVDRLEEKLGLLSLGVMLAYDCKIRYSDMFTSVKLWDVVIHNYLIDQNIVVPLQSNSHKEELVGAYVRDPIVGLHKWVATFDVNSLYPSIIVQNNMSPETYMGMIDVPEIESLLAGMLPTSIRDYISNRNCALGANGSLWNKDRRGSFPELVLKMYADRVKFKDLMVEAKKNYEINPTIENKNLITKYNNLQMVRKICLNSLYGATGNPSFRYYRTAYAEGITKTGQLAIQWVAKDIDLYLNKVLKTNDIQYVIYIDTDSCFVSLDTLVTQVFDENEDVQQVTDFINKVCKIKLEDIIQKSFDRFKEYLNSYVNQMKMKRENIANRAIFLAKKKYIMNVYDSEGFRYQTPNLYMKGIEAVRSSTPTSCREKIKESLVIIMNRTNDELIKFIDDFRVNFKNMDFVDIAFPRGCNNMAEYSCKTNIYRPKTPMQVRGALLYNKLLLDMGLKNKYTTISEGDKIKFCYLKKPNPIRENVITVVDQLPDEFNLKQYIDYDTQFEKAFLNPVKSICDAIGWKTEEISTLENFFN